MKRITKFLSIAALIFSLAGIAFAQERTGSIEGTVKDQQGALVPGITVTVASGGVFNRTTTTDDQGFFRIIQVPSGTYTVATSGGNFQPASRSDVLVTLGQATPVDFTVQPAQVGAAVTITSGEVALVDPTTSKIQANITAQQIERLPRGVGFTSALKAAAPVRDEVTAGGFQIDGASGAENTFIIDGQEVTNFRTGALNSNNNIPFQFVQEIQVKTNGFEAEFGGATGGVINVVTKSGTNAWHGELGMQFEPSKLFARPRQILAGDNVVGGRYIQPKRDSFLNTFPALTFGGPIVKNRIFFFGNFTPQFYHTDRNFIYPDGTAARYVSNVRRDYGFARVDANVTSKFRVNGTYTYNPIRLHGVIPSFTTLDGAGTASNAPSPADQLQQGGRQPAVNLNVEGTWTPTSKLVVNARAGRGYLNEKLSNYGIPHVVNYTCSTGRAGSCNTGFRLVNTNDLTNKDISTRKTFDANVSYLFNKGGRHNFKFGYQMNKLANDVNSGSFDTGTIDFGFGLTTTDRSGNERGFGKDPGALGVGTLTLFGTTGNVTSKNQALYWQDSWQPTSRLTLNLGARIEKENVPTFVAGGLDINFNWGSKFAPRIGGAFDVRGDGKWKVFASFGRFFDRFKYELPRGSFGGEKYLVYDFLVVNPSIFSYTRDQIIASNLNINDFRTIANRPENNTIAPGLKPFRQTEYTVGTEYEISHNMVFAGRYTRKKVDRAIEDTGFHVPNDPSDTLFSNEQYFIANPGFGVCAKLACGKYPIVGPPGPKARRQYDAVEVRLDKRFAENYYLNANYTWSRLIGNYAGLSSSDEAQRGAGFGRLSPNVNRNFDIPQVGFTTDGKPDDGRLPTDRPHLIKVASGYTYNWFGSKTNSTDISGFYSIGSGEPVTSRVRLAFVSGQILSGRGDLGRTHRLSQTDFSIRQTYRFGNDGRFAMAFDVNVLNLLNQGIELSRRETLSRANIALANFPTVTNFRILDQAIFDGRITSAKIRALIAAGTVVKDQRYNLAQLYQDPRAIRFGFRFMF